MIETRECGLWRPPGGSPAGLQEPPRYLEASSPTPSKKARRTAMSENFDKLNSIIESTREDVEKAEAGNKAATSRVRKAMQDIKAVAQDIRKEMLELRDAGGK